MNNYFAKRIEVGGMTYTEVITAYPSRKEAIDAILTTDGYSSTIVV